MFAVSPIEPVDRNQQTPGLSGMRVLAFESRRAQEIGKLIASHGGQATVAVSMREVDLADNTDAVAFAHALVDGKIDVAIFLTGVGTRALARVMETIYPRARLVAALSRISLVARGPKPATVLQEMGLRATIAVPEPNTWRDLLRMLDENAAVVPLQGRRVALQEYGVSNAELVAALQQRGAILMRVPVYQWALPEDIHPLRAAVESIVAGAVDIVLFTTSVQVDHLLQIARQMTAEDALRLGLSRIVVGSIGPITSEALREHGFQVDFEPPHPKMGFLVAEAARRGPSLVESKRSAPRPG